MVDLAPQAVSQLLSDARQLARTPSMRSQLGELADRFQGPLRVAVAGKVKAGKSTLLNALLGEGLAATDAGECTQLVTWYSHGEAPVTMVHPRSGPAQVRPFDRDGGAVAIELGPYRVQDVDHLDVRWPNSRLRHLTLIDTPGLASISTDVSERTYAALAPDDERPAVADAVVYLLRHTHASDVHFLEAFHTDELAHGTPMNAVGVLSRADEIGSARSDALDVAERIARRYRDDVRLRRICPLVVPVAGLLAYGGSTLTHPEYRALSTLAAAPAQETEPLLLTADRLARRPSALAVTEIEREHLLRRLGLFGVRVSVQMLRAGAASTSTELSTALAELSGLQRLRGVLTRQFSQRSQVLKARSALLGLQAALASGEVDDTVALSARTESLIASAHAFAEVRMLAAMRTGEVQLPPARAAALERLLGGLGHDAATRLDLPADAPEDRVREAAGEALETWRRVGEHPLSTRPVQLAAQTAVRTLEGLLGDVP